MDGNVLDNVLKQILTTLGGLGVTVVIIGRFSTTMECSDKVDGYALTVDFRLKIVKMGVRRLIYI